jgi:cyclic pyranopterin phosphate synthase
MELIKPWRLSDQYGRVMKKLRIQLLDACQMRCTYCMPENPVFLPRHQLLSSDEIANIVGNLVSLGIDELRVTGGEPLLRADFREIIAKLSIIHAKSFGMTTNGALLGQHLDFLKDTPFHHLNISLDSLKEERFFTITRSKAFKTIVTNIMRARDLGFAVKLNTVIMKGINDDELLDFVRFAKEENIEVRFLEYMKVGPATASFDAHFLPAETMRQIIAKEGALSALPAPNDATAKRFQSASGAKIGFIASESEPFCGSCSRLRLSATGKLRACLFSEEGIDLRGKTLEEYPEIVKKVIALKPAGRIFSIAESMNVIGG